MSALSVSYDSATVLDHKISLQAVIFDLDEVLERVGHDRLLLTEITGLLEQDAKVRLAELQVALAWFDVRAFEQAAHALKGMLANFAARSAVETATTLEEMGRTRRWMNAGHFVQLLECQIKELVQDLNRLEMETA